MKRTIDKLRASTESRIENYRYDLRQNLNSEIAKLQHECKHEVKYQNRWEYDRGSSKGETSVKCYTCDKYLGYVSDYPKSEVLPLLSTLQCQRECEVLQKSVDKSLFRTELMKLQASCFHDEQFRSDQKVNNWFSNSNKYEVRCFHCDKAVGETDDRHFQNLEQCKNNRSSER